MATINFYSSSDEYAWLSNFWPAEITMNGKTYPTVEHYFQWQKARDAHDNAAAEAIRTASTPAKAKAMGRKVKGLDVESWDIGRVATMYMALLAKFEQNPDLREKLLETGNAELVEASPSDYYWGIGRKRTGKNMLGELLMGLRAKLRGTLI